MFSSKFTVRICLHFKRQARDTAIQYTKYAVIVGSLLLDQGVIDGVMQDIGMAKASALSFHEKRIL